MTHILARRPPAPRRTLAAPRGALVVLCLAATFGVACNDDEDDAPLTCDTQPLFGQPADNTGLPEGACQPSCQCGGVDFVQPTYTAETVASLRARVHLNPPPLATVDPYDEPEQWVEVPDAVCGALFDDTVTGGYRLETYADDAAATEAGAVITHYGACGTCSSFQDLAVYIETPNLTDPVRTCGIRSLTEGDEAAIACIEEIGFSPACAQTWFFNTRNTRLECLAVCLTNLNAPNHRPDGSLNPCIQCDEDLSGPVFKAAAGRTRRNSGIGSALCRPCDDVRPVIHDY